MSEQVLNLETNVYTVMTFRRSKKHVPQNMSAICGQNNASAIWRAVILDNLQNKESENDITSQTQSIASHSNRSRSHLLRVLLGAVNENKPSTLVDHTFRTFEDFEDLSRLFKCTRTLGHAPWQARRLRPNSLAKDAHLQMESWFSLRWKLIL